MSDVPHISVCICTYKRPYLLANLLSKLQDQQTEGLFTYSIVVVDNDREETGRSAVETIKESSKIEIHYCVEPEQSIALARNRAVQNAQGHFVGFIDDDEVPINTWLQNLYLCLKEYECDGVLGPVIPHFEKRPPDWIIKGRIFERPNCETGKVLRWEETRTGNALLKKDTFNGEEYPFDLRLGSGGEDRAFFKRMMQKGCVFRWCAAAEVYESVPPERQTRSFLLRRALLRGQVSVKHPSFHYTDILKSLFALPIYTAALPVLIFAGHHRFMKCLIRAFDHLGRLLTVFQIAVIKEKYVIK